MGTKHEQTLKILEQNQFTETKYPGKYSREGVKKHVYLGRRSSVRIGENKASSIPIGPKALAVLLPGLVRDFQKEGQERTGIVLDQEKKLITRLRREAHSLIQSANLETLNQVIHLLKENTVTK